MNDSQRVFVVVNQVFEIGFRQTTALLIASLVKTGCEVHLANVDGFSIEGTDLENRLVAKSFRLQPDAISQNLLAGCDRDGKLVQVQSNDLILIRTNPGRDQERSAIHDTFLNLCRMAQSTGVRVVNDPTTVRFFACKSSLALLAPEYRPPMLVSHDENEVARFVSQSNKDCVVKPLVGSRGKDVIRLRPNQTDVADLIKTTFDGRGVIVQHFVNSNQPGDLRVVVVHGKILESNGHIAGIARHPADGDFRANLHTGGTAHPVKLTTSARLAVQQSAKLLSNHGIWIAGVDLIEDQVIEFNVFSTGGLFDAIRFSGIDFADQVVNLLLDRY